MPPPPRRCCASPAASTELGATHGLVAIRDRVSGGPLRLFGSPLDLRPQR
ncbi:hypothetical protein [Nannocystis pusilla]